MFKAAGGSAVPNSVFHRGGWWQQNANAACSVGVSVEWPDGERQCGQFQEPRFHVCGSGASSPVASSRSKRLGCLPLPSTVGSR